MIFIKLNKIDDDSHDNQNPSLLLSLDYALPPGSLLSP